MPPNPLYYGAQVADLIRDRGRIEAQRASTRGATLASAFQAVPQALVGFVQAREARRLAAQAEAERFADRQWQDQQRARTMAEWGRKDAITDAARLVPRGPDGQPDYSRIASEVALIDPMAAAPYRQLADADIAKAKQNALERAETIAKELSGATDQATWDTALNRLAKKGIRGVPRVFDIGTRDSSVAEALSFGEWLKIQTPKTPKTREIKVTNPDGTETIQVVEDRPGQTFTSTPKKDEPTPGSLAYELVAEARSKRIPVEALTTADRARVKARWDAAGRAPTEPKATDDPELPRGVVDYIGSMRSKTTNGQPYTYEDAQADLAATWPTLRRDHPRVDVVKTDTALRSLFRPAPGAGTQSLMELLIEMQGGSSGQRPVAPFGPAVLNADPTSQRPTAPVTAPSIPIVQKPTPSANTTRQNMTPSIPPDVYGLLATGAPGRYTMTDGSVWEKAADGTIRRVQ